MKYFIEPIKTTANIIKDDIISFFKQTKIIANKHVERNQENNQKIKQLGKYQPYIYIHKICGDKKKTLTVEKYFIKIKPCLKDITNVIDDIINGGVVVITNTNEQLHSAKPKLSICAESNLPTPWWRLKMVKISNNDPSWNCS